MENSSSTKFYVWLEERWCELDTSTGVIETRRHKARFVYYRNGALHLARTETVLRGLRALAAGRPTTVFDGPPLPYCRVSSIERGGGRKRAHRHERDYKRRRRDRHRCSTLEEGAHSCEKVDAGVQVGPSLCIAKRPGLSLSLRRHKPPNVLQKRRPSTECEILGSDKEIDRVVNGGRTQVTKSVTNGHVVKEKEIQIELTPLKNIKKISEESKKRLLEFKKSRLKKDEIITIIDNDSEPVDGKLENNRKSMSENEDLVPTEENERRVKEPSLEESEKVTNRIKPRQSRQRRRKSTEDGSYKNSSEDNSEDSESSMSTVEENYSKIETRQTRSLNKAPAVNSSDEFEPSASKTKSAGEIVTKDNPKNLARKLDKSTRESRKSTFDNNTITEIRMENIQDTRLRRRETRVKSTDTQERAAPKRALRSRSLTAPKRGPFEASTPVTETTTSETSGKRCRTETETSKSSIDEFLSVRRDRAKKGSTSPAPDFKELIVEEEDVEALRDFLLRTNNSFDVDKFDHDEAYKKSIFYLINPLVYVERDEEIARRLQAPSKDYFASQLGLRSVSEVSSKRHSSRLRMQQRRPSSDSDRENISGSASRHAAKSANMKPLKDSNERKRDNVLNTSVTKRAVKNYDDKKRRSITDSSKRTRQSNARSSLDSNERKRDGVRDANIKKKAVKNSEDRRRKQTLELKKRKGRGGKASNEENMDRDSVEEQDSSSEFKKMKHIVKGVNKQSVSLAGGKEYSSLEDQAIVAWVSSGGRARLVNGNRLWRELQDHYPRITGKARTWQSLRNRYLRHVLPALGGMALAPAHAARLRAAAATGELKRKVASRRNSIFKPPERGASSWRPRASSDHEDEEESSSEVEPPRKQARRSPPPAVARSPRYSQLLRDFQARHKTSSAPPSPARSPAPRGERRGRKLFNPNAVP